ncbi:MAG: zinc ABC transporter solute-binding protein [Erysipelothrix sp.]|nr:zinc ABC transporter solute-binding protein [Erysipelothrix sp.]
MKKHILKLLVIVSLTLSLTGCIRSGLDVVVTNYPLQFLVESIAGDRVSVTRLDLGNVAQRARINPQYENILKSADVLFYINEAQPYLELYEEELKAMKGDSVDLSYYSKLYDFKRYQNINVSGTNQTFESDYYETDLLDNADLYNSDPILWIDPIAMTSMGRSILDYLVDAFPDQKSYYEENFEKLEIELVRLYADYQKLRNVQETISFVSMTPTFGNWQKSYGINVYPLTLSKYGVLPDELLLNVYRERISADNVEYIVYENNLPQDYINLFNKIKTELNLTQINLHNLYTLSAEDIKNNENYINLMYKNLETLSALETAKELDEE